MTELTAHDFPAYFRDVHGCEPFPWQTRLTERVLETGAWPEVIDLPTGSGKTAVLDTAVFALACHPENFPRRVVFVIDRRIIVDQVYERAKIIQEKIHAAETLVLRQIKNNISHFFEAPISGAEEKSKDNKNLLGVVTLRGGIPIDSEWSHRPDLPWVVVSTVDQFGSRLLFRGYGVSQKMRSVHAGLAGNDCLVILDEVHLSRPFAETLAAVKADHFGNMLPQRKFYITEMSATPSISQQEPFKLEQSDLELSETLRQRVQAEKTAILKKIGKAKEPPEIAISEEIKKMLKKREIPSEAKCVGIIVNRVRTAREIHKSLIHVGVKSHLITGRMRPLDKEKVFKKIENLVSPENRTRPEDTTFVVATQAIEVGADFSFDALITECAPIDSLKQRFGRLDRRGTLQSQTGSLAKAWILGVNSNLKQKSDPIYGEAVLATWEELMKRLENKSEDKTSEEDSHIEQVKQQPQNLGIGTQSYDLADFPAEAHAPSQEAPLLLPTYMNAWAQTNPEPIVQPDITQFLHGKEASNNSDVTVIWRWDCSKETLRIVPPRPAEYLQVPIKAVKAWLKSENTDEIPIADSESFISADEQPKKSKNIKEPSGDSRTLPAHRWFRWKDHENEPDEIRVAEIKPGDILLVSPSSGGLSHGNWDPESTKPVEDLGDEAQFAYQRQVTIRLDTSIYPDTPIPPSEESEISSKITIQEWLETQQQDESNLIEIAEKLLKNGYKTHLRSPSENHFKNPNKAYFILQGNFQKRNKGNIDVDYSTFDGSDEMLSSTGVGTTLKKHMNGVGEVVAIFAKRLHLPEKLQEDLRLAGQLHDLGKVDPRFQLRLVGGDSVRRAGLDEPLAKSLPDTPKAEGYSNSKDLYPKGMRHEMASLALIDSNPGVLETAHDPDLVLHLVATHHGHARPIPKIIEDPNPQKLKYTHNDHVLETESDLENTLIAIEAADRFWRLTEKYGHHGLAWLEAILRLADHRQSEREGRK